MSLQVGKKPIKEFSTETSMVYQASQKGKRLYAKMVQMQKAEQMGIEDCLEFNRQVMADLGDFPFPEHFLKIQEDFSSEEIHMTITEVYETTLEQYIYKKSIQQKEALAIFSQVVRAAYSVVMSGYWHRNIRPLHFVKCGDVWKMESLVYSEDYLQAEGGSSEFLWDPKYQAPEFSPKGKYEDDDFNLMMVWNLGSLLLDMLLGGHKLSNREVTEKFKGKPFSFEAIGIKKEIAERFSEDTRVLLASMLHHDPKRRMKLIDFFKSYDPVVGKHYNTHHKEIPASKIALGKSSRTSSITPQLKVSVRQANIVFQERDKEKRKLLENSRISDVLDSDDFLGNLQQLSVQIPSKQYKVREKEKKEEEGPVELDSLLTNKNHPTRKALELYKSYYDQSELLVIATQVVDKLKLTSIKDPREEREVKLYCKYAITLLSMINLHALAEGFNQNRNILDLDGDLFTAFQAKNEYSAFQKFLNFKRKERAVLLDSLKQEISMLKQKKMGSDARMGEIMTSDYKTTLFSQIKYAYRFIVKHAYDSISEQYNKERSEQLARTAMYVTYCLTVDKMYIKEHIPDNFKYYFQWLNKSPCNYVPLVDFKRYIEEAPRDLLIENSRFILQKYYTI